MMVEVELTEIAFAIRCDCGRSFRAEDLKPECPYCGRKYSLSISGEPEAIKLEIKPLEKSELND